MPETETSGADKELGVPPCFRCLFEQPISPSQCDPAKCDMLDFWLFDVDFSWDKYLFGWKLSVEIKATKKNGLPLDEEPELSKNL